MNIIKYKKGFRGIVFINDFMLMNALQLLHAWFSNYFDLSVSGESYEEETLTRVWYISL